MKALVTGSAGFIGFHLINALLSRGDTVVGIDSLYDNGDQNMKLARLSLQGVDTASIAPGKELSGSLGYRFIQMDICDRAGMLALAEQEKFDIIFHLAAVTGNYFAKKAPDLFADVNIYGTTSVLEAARKTGVQHFVFTSSAAVYGRKAVSPLTEHSDTTHPLSMYGASKRSAELMCYTYALSYNLPVTVFRLFNAYGKWGRPDSIFMHAAQDIIEGNTITLLNDGYIVRDFTYVDDMVDGLLAAAANPPYGANGVPYEAFNIARSKPVQLAAIIEAMENVLGKKANVVTKPESTLTIGENPEIYASCEKMESVLAYSPVWDYEKALEDFLDWFVKNYKVSFIM